MANTTKDLIHDLFSQGKSYREIAVEINSNASAVAARIQGYRKKDPAAWPRLRKYVEPLLVDVQIFKCCDCHFLFAVEKESEFLDDVTCPICWEKKQLQDIGSTNLKLTNLH